MPPEENFRVAGWCVLRSRHEGLALPKLSSLLDPSDPRRSSLPYRDLRPYSRENAPPHSMSAIVGTDCQPFHTDASYLPSPPRFVVLECLDPGEAPCPTRILPLNVERLKIERPKNLTRIHWVTVAAGYQSFYCPIAEETVGSMRVRFDPICMQPCCSGPTSDEAYAALSNYGCPHDIHWAVGQVLVIDNWRCLHGRGLGAERSPSRRLRRWEIEATHGLEL